MACRLAVIGLAGALTLLPARATAQGLSLGDVEFDGGVGYSFVNVTAWLAGGTLVSDNRLASGGDGRVIFFNSGPFRLGAEVGYHYYWSYRAIFGTSGVIRDVDADHISLVARVLITPRLSLDVGGGAQFFDGFTDVGLQGAIRYAIPVNERLSIPIGVRADLILDSTTALLPVMLTAGFAIRP
jgi:hypothetical protein